MKLRRLLAAFAAPFLLLPAPSALCEDSGRLVLTAEQEHLLPSVLESLRALKADPEGVGSVLQRISEQEKSAEGELGQLDSNLSELGGSLSREEAHRQELLARLKALELSLQLFKEGTPVESIPPATAPPPAARPAEPGKVVPTSGAQDVRFNRDVRRILSNNCFACHGPDPKTLKAGLRLDDGVGAFQTLKSGAVAIVPGSREKSELWKRITTSHEGDKMPPSSFEKTLKPEEIETIGRWIDQGAKYEGHWAFIPPERPSLPEVSDESWVRNEIDSFILARLDSEGLKPSPEADKRRLARRAHFDVTGLPPDPAEIEAFVQDQDPKAYEKYVDQLLQRPQFGEHMTRYWMDVSRYADTNGYHIDNARYMWPWRDWVINAFNQNMPFNQFTLEQIAGDLLPDAGVSQKVASGFNRNHMITFEGGVIDEEYRVQYVVDRVNTTGTAWLGLTVGCAQCHDHKYDPISQKEYYQLYAFFNTIPEKGIDGVAGNASPLIRVPDVEQETKLTTLSEKIAGLDEALYAPDAVLDASQAAWETETSGRLAKRWAALRPLSATSTTESTLRILEDHSVIVEGATPEKDVYEVVLKTELMSVTAIRLEALTDESLPGGGAGRADNSNFVLTDVDVEITDAGNPVQYTPVPIKIAKADFSQADFPVKNAIDDNAESGWAVQGMDRKENRSAMFVPERAFGGFGAGTQIKLRLKFESPFAQHAIGRFRISASSEPLFTPSTLSQWYHNGPFVGATHEATFERAYDPENGVDLAAVYEDGRMKWVKRPDFLDETKNDLPGDVCANYLYRTIESPGARTMDLSLGSNDSLKVWVNGELVHENPDARGLQPDSDRVTVPLVAGTNHLLLKVVNAGGQHGFYFSRADEEVGEIPFKVENVLYLAKESRNPEQAKEVVGYYRKNNSEDWRRMFDERQEVAKEHRELEASLPTTMVMAEMEEPRDTFMLDRGQYDLPTEKVEPALPAVFSNSSGEGELTRLDLARWIVDDRNPLTARVTVNRLWQQLFGTGLVKSVEDFGIQGDWPSHPELLDWLATEFVRSGWNIKELYRLMLTSSAYRQSTQVTPELFERDPENRLLARGPRHRLDAEVIRDGALAISGLLNPVVGGESVKPYQPEGIWEEVAFGGDFTAQTFEQDRGDKLYRRSMYTFWKRQSPPPNMLIFDAPTREVCVARRPRTNTPLQALTLMNDPQYVEAARALAEKMMTEGGESPVEKITYAFQRAVSRPPEEKETQVLLKVYEEQLADYLNKADQAKQLIEVGESAPREGLDPCQLAAWTSVASVLLNLDETITKG